MTEKIIIGAQAWDAKGQMWGLDPAQVPAAQANKTVARLRITYADGAVEEQPHIRNPTAPHTS